MFVFLVRANLRIPLESWTNSDSNDAFRYFLGYIRVVSRSVQHTLEPWPGVERIRCYFVV